tara:strand:+ start:2220 stop:2477 length:258 start_codon:yes stop_codon:yes gene_type:complete
MKADKQSKIDRRNEKRGIMKPHKTYKDIVDEEHKEVATVEEKQPIEEIVEEYKAEEKKEEEKKPEEKKPEEKKPKRKYTKKSKSA